MQYFICNLENPNLRKSAQILVVFIFFNTRYSKRKVCFRIVHKKGNAHFVSSAESTLSHTTHDDDYTDVHNIISFML